MSLIGTTFTSAVALAEQRSKRLGGNMYVGRPIAMLERNFMAVRSTRWIAVVTGFFEPVFYLLAFGLGIGGLIGNVTDGQGNPVSYAAFIAPALLATSAMNGAIYDSTWNVFFKMHFGKLYDTAMSTSLGPLDVALGEISWGLLRGLAYAIGFMSVISAMGLVTNWWGLLAIPAALLVAFGFSSFGMAVTSYMKSFQQMNWINLVLMPMFLFSGTFFPLSVFPQGLQVVIQALPLWQGIEMIRSLTLGQISLDLAWHALYFVSMITIGLVFTTKRLSALFLR
jgi:lipooligosaccharide transport system permease protein